MDLADPPTASCSETASNFRVFAMQWPLDPHPMGSKLQRLDLDSDSEKTSVNAGQSLVDSDSKWWYQSMVGSLMWLMLYTWPDLAFTVSILSKFNNKPTTEYLAAATYTLWYRYNTANLGIQYNVQNLNIPIGYTDSDFAGDPDDRKSTSSYIFMLAGGVVSWRTQKQPLVAFSTVEAEYIVASDVAKEAIWIQSLYSQVLYGQTLYQHTNHCPHCLCPNDNSQAQSVEPQEIFVENQGTIKLAKNPKFHKRTNHISVRFHFTVMPVRERLSRWHTYQHLTCSVTSWQRTFPGKHSGSMYMDQDLYVKIQGKTPARLRQVGESGKSSSNEFLPYTPLFLSPLSFLCRFHSFSYVRGFPCVGFLYGYEF